MLPTPFSLLRHTETLYGTPCSGIVVRMCPSALATCLAVTELFDALELGTGDVGLGLEVSPYRATGVEGIRIVYSQRMIILEVLNGFTLGMKKMSVYRSLTCVLSMENTLLVNGRLLSLHCAVDDAPWTMLYCARTFRSGGQ